MRSPTHARSCAAQEEDPLGFGQVRLARRGPRPPTSRQAQWDGIGVVGARLQAPCRATLRCRQHKHRPGGTLQMPLLAACPVDRHDGMPAAVIAALCSLQDGSFGALRPGARLRRGMAGRRRLRCPPVHPTCPCLHLPPHPRGGPSPSLPPACLPPAAQNLQVPIFSEPGAPPFLDSVIYGYTSGPGADAPKGEINRAGVISAGRFT